jgi:predicted transcriptional regulator
MAERKTRVTCSLCQNENRDGLEQELVNGTITPKELDKKMEWREGITTRHFENHMGDYHMGSNSDCTICTHHMRAQFESAYYQQGMNAAQISEEVGCAESTVYHHLKFHFQPLIQPSAAQLVAIHSGDEMDALRGNLSRINGELGQLLDDADRNDPQYYRNVQMIHKEVRETVKDLVKMQERFSGDGLPGTIHATTVNLIKLELVKESPEVWKRIRHKLMEDDVFDT